MNLPSLARGTVKTASKISPTHNDRRWRSLSSHLSYFVCATVIIPGGEAGLRRTSFARSTWLALAEFSYATVDTHP